MKGNLKGKKDVRRIIKKSSQIKRTILFLTTFCISYIILLTAVTPQKYNLRVGDISRQDIKATKEIVDENATAEKEKQAIDKVDKQYAQKTEVKKQADDNITELFQKLISISESSFSDDQKVEELKKIKGIVLTSDEASVLLTIQKDELSGLQTKVLDIIDKIYEKNIGEDVENDVKPARKEAVEAIEELGLNSNVATVLEKIVEKQINTNFFYDKEKTEEVIKEVQKNLSKVIIKQNQTIVREGEPVTQQQLDILSSLGMLDDDNFAGYIQIYLTLAVFIQIIMLLQYNYIHKNYAEIYKSNKKLAMISSINIISLIFARGIGAVSPYLIPFACAPMLLALLTNYKLSLTVSTLNAILICAANGFEVQIIILAILGAVLGSTLLKNMQQRNELIYSSIYISIVSMIIAVSTGLLNSSNTNDVLLKTVFASASGILSGILALGILPFLEGTFNEVTVLKLVELSNPNNVLLKKLLMDAPGTYHHSMLVANLAEMAAEEIGANSIIVRIGAYFHDIGKTERPYFFGENQISEQNPHDMIEPNVSAKIILSHVTDGIELAKKHNLPKVIQDIIAEHHGTTTVKYFYYTMKNKAENPDDINIDDYRYKGPIPSSKESAIIMISDSVEAAVRSIKEPTEEKISAMIENIIKDKLDAGQFNNCDLTISDIEKIKKCLVVALNGIYHHRIEYPKDNTKELSKVKDDKKGETK